MQNELLTHLLGEGSPAKFLAAIIYALLGAFLHLLLGTTKRNPASERTPSQFSWNFLWCDNTKRIVRSILLIVLTIRFARELMGAEVTMYAAVLIGLAVDKLAEMWTSKPLKVDAVPFLIGICLLGLTGTANAQTYRPITFDDIAPLNTVGVVKYSGGSIWDDLGHVKSKYDTTVLHNGKEICSHKWQEKDVRDGQYSEPFIICAVGHDLTGCPDTWMKKNRICEYCLRHEHIKETRYIDKPVNMYDELVKKLESKQGNP